MGKNKRRVMFRIIFLIDAEKTFKKLDKSVQKKIGKKIDWLKENADKIVHHYLVGLPSDLVGLCRIRVGDYRIIYWIYPENKLIKIYAIEHRSLNYRSIRRPR